MAAKAFDLAQYQHLLSETAPIVPETKEENEQLLARAKALHQKEKLSPEEEKLLHLILLLIEDFEERFYRSKQATSHEILRELMRARGLQPKDLWPVFGSRGITSEVLKGKRGISKQKAKSLAELFNVSADLFI